MTILNYNRDLELINCNKKDHFEKIFVLFLLLFSILFVNNSNVAAFDEVVEFSLKDGQKVDKISPWGEFVIEFYNGISCCGEVEAKIKLFPDDDCGTRIYEDDFYINDLGKDFDEDKEDGKFIGLIDLTHRFNLQKNEDLSCYKALIEIPFSKIYNFNKTISLILENKDYVKEIAIENNFLHDDINKVHFDISSNKNILFETNFKQIDVLENICDIKNKEFTTSLINNGDFEVDLPIGQYNLSIYPIDDFNNYGKLNEVLINIKDESKPDKVNLNAKYFNSLVYLTWTKSKDNVGINGYAIYRRDENKKEFKKIGFTNKTYYFDSNIDDNSTYSYFILAQDCYLLLSNNSNQVNIEVFNDDINLDISNFTYHKDGVTKLYLDLDDKKREYYYILYNTQKKDIHDFEYSFDEDKFEIISKLIPYESYELKNDIIKFNANEFGSKNELKLGLIVYDNYGNYDFQNVSLNPIYSPPNLEVNMQKQGRFINYFFNTNRNLECVLEVKDNQDNFKEKEIYFDFENNQLLNLFDDYYNKGVNKYLIYFNLSSNKLLETQNLVPEDINRMVLFSGINDFNSELICSDDFGYIVTKETSFYLNDKLVDEIFFPNKNYNILNFMFINPTLKSNLKISVMDENNNSILLMDEGFMYLKKSKEINDIKFSSNYKYPLLFYSIDISKLYDIYENQTILFEFKNDELVFEHEYILNNYDNLKFDDRYYSQIFSNFSKDYSFSIFEYITKENNDIESFYGELIKEMKVPALMTSFAIYGKNEKISLLVILFTFIVLSILLFSHKLIIKRFSTNKESRNNKSKKDIFKENTKKNNFSINKDKKIITHKKKDTFLYSKTRDKNEQSDINKKVVDDWIKRSQKHENLRENKDKNTEIKKKKENQDDKDYIFHDSP